MTVLVATTTAPYKADGTGELAWLSTAAGLRAYHPDTAFFAALETDGRGMEPYAALTDRLASLGGIFWRFSIDDGEAEVNGPNRLMRICTGRNLAHEYALRTGASHLLFLDSDVVPQPDAIPRLLELHHPVTAGHIPTYNLHGPKVDVSAVPDADVERHWSSAGFLMLERQVFRHVSWHYDPDAGLTDDPTFQRETAELFGETWTRHDVVGTHVPETIGPVQDRGHDLARVPW